MKRDRYDPDFMEDDDFPDKPHTTTWKDVLFYSCLVGFGLAVVIMAADMIDRLVWLWWCIFGVGVVMCALRFIRRNIFNK